MLCANFSAHCAPRACSTLSPLRSCVLHILCRHDRTSRDFVNGRSPFYLQFSVISLAAGAVGWIWGVIWSCQGVTGCRSHFGACRCGLGADCAAGVGPARPIDAQIAVGSVDGAARDQARAARETPALRAARGGRAQAWRGALVSTRACSLVVVVSVGLMVVILLCWNVVLIVRNQVADHIPAPRMWVHQSIQSP